MRIVHLPVTTSTSDIIKKLGIHDEDVLVYADIQTKGRGTNGKTWCSAPGNLHMSFSTSYRDDPKLLSYITCCALHKTISFYAKYSKNIQIKPPNDILVSYKKISGILIENVFDKKFVIGIGVNLENAPINESTCFIDAFGVCPRIPEFIDYFLSTLQFVRNINEVKIKRYYYRHSY